MFIEDNFFDIYLLVCVWVCMCVHVMMLLWCQTMTYGYWCSTLPCGFLDQAQDIRLASKGFYPLSPFVRLHGNYEWSIFTIFDAKYLRFAVFYKHTSAWIPNFHRNAYCHDKFQKIMDEPMRLHSQNYSRYVRNWTLK